MYRTAGLFLAVSAVNAQMLVTPDWLAGRLKDPAVVVLHVGSAEDYAASHVPGARLVTLGDVSVTDGRGMRLQLPPVADLVAAFGKAGVTDQSRVVVYAGTSSVQSATRVWFTLDYLGLSERTSLLDGGLAAWRAANHPVNSDAVPPVTGTFTPRPSAGVVVDAGWIQANSKYVDLVDARTSEFYSGASAGSMPRAGHIPGARNVPFNTLLDETGKFRAPDTLRNLLGGTKNIVTYCHIGQQATVPYFVARLLGLDVKLYDGSFQDWSSRPELPLGKL